MNTTTNETPPAADSSPATNGTELATREPDETKAARKAMALAEGPAGNPFASTKGFEHALRSARALSTSTVVPKAYQGNLGNCIVAIEMASRVGASPLAVMQNLDVIHGKPSWRSTFLIALIKQSGKFGRLRYEWQGKPGEKDWGCKAIAKDLESGVDLVGVTITWKMVTEEGWAGRDGSKWKTMPELMFHYRAAAFWARIHAPELVLGMQTNDEVEDVQRVPAMKVTKPSTTTAAELDAELLGDAAEPPLEGEAAPQGNGSADRPAAGQAPF